MSRNKLNPNKPFMVLNGILSFAVFVVVCLFLYIAFKYRRDADRIKTYDGKYQIELAKEFAGNNISVYLNDSLLLNQIIPDSAVQLSINRFADEHVLMIVDNETENTTPFSLNSKGSKVTVKLTDGIISILEQSDAY